MIRHASVEELARYDEDDLRPRKRARIAAHLSVCVQCSGNHQRLHAMATILADVSYPPMPEHLSAKINVAIASESAARLASEPATEGGRRDLPERKRSARTGVRLPGLSSPLGLRVAAAAGAAVIVAGGGYAIATGLGSFGPSTASAPQVGSGAQASLKPAPTTLHYQMNGRSQQIQMVTSNVDFQRGKFKGQALAAVAAERRLQSRRAQVSGASASIGAAAGVPTPSAPASSLPGVSAGLGFAGPAAIMSKLQGCVSDIAGGRTVLLVEQARFEGKTAFIIVVRLPRANTLDAYAVGSSCSATNKAIRFSITLPNP